VIPGLSQHNSSFDQKLDPVANDALATLKPEIFLQIPSERLLILAILLADAMRKMVGFNLRVHPHFLPSV
jgi:hypothetical protein